MSRHVSTEKLARFRSDDLRRAAARRVRRHLAGCARCQETESALAAIPDLLASVPAPPIPAHLAARIETALATESAHRAAGSPSMRSGTAGLPSAAAHRRSRSSLPGPALRVLTAAAVIVVIGGGGYELVSHLGGGVSSSGASSGSAAVAAPGRKTLHAGSSSASTAGPMVPGAVTPAAGAGPVLRYRRGAQLATVRPVRTATNYQPARLAAQVRGTLAQQGPLGTNRPGVSPQSNSGSAAFGAAQLSRLAGCVSRVAAGDSVVLVDVARYRGGPATVIVTAARGAGGDQIWVVGDQCSRSASDVLAHRPLPG
jgi:hypothetical protein